MILKLHVFVQKKSLGSCRVKYHVCEENRWISMSERWPEENQRCLIYPIDDEAEVAYLENGKFHFWDGYYANPDEILYWRPLPELPEDKEVVES